MKPDGDYATVIEKHTYIEWLVNEHYANFQHKKIPNSNVHPLNSEEMLVINSPINVGDERIEKMISILKKKRNSRIYIIMSSFL